ncbi:sensor histidine kinase [Pseudorhodoferax sp.]|uniref:sensor histidine kinase n=1 Tax=Pseudorhodoferax sp. TaxID=1993553 RepID=UPI002DD69257|nr:ATP-binding protein [Pseudorhodoferax sp.]
MTLAVSNDPPAAAPAAPPPASPPRRGPRRTVLWGLLLLLLLVAQSLLVALTVNYEASRAQEEVESIAAEAAIRLRRDVLQAMQQLQVLSWPGAQALDWPSEALGLMHGRRELLRVERRDAGLRITSAADSPNRPPLFTTIARADLSIDTDVACLSALRQASPLLSRSYFVPQPDGRGVEVADLCVPIQRAGTADGFVVGSFGLALLLDTVMTPEQARHTEISVVEGDGARLARAGGPRGAGVFVAERLVDLPGSSLRLRVDSSLGQPSLIPNLMLALVLGLSVALFGVVLLLARDVRRRAEAERALAEALSVRKAMEDSLITGLRARNLDGTVTYANPAFCAMVGFDADEMKTAVPPYWPPEQVDEYRGRQRTRLASPQPEQLQLEGFETVFMRKNGERFPVVIYEAPLMDSLGRHTGWMSTVLDVSAQRRVEELSRQQQDRLQASARLATVGEMASLMSHELNQPLAAIASYASGSLNLLDEPPAAGDAPGMPHQMLGLVRQALERINEQAERAGRIIKSVHSFVRRREHLREAIGTDLLIDGVLPLVRLQARKSGTRVELDLPRRAPRVVCDRTMLEQVLINLTRNGIQAMEGAETALEDRVLTLRVRQHHEQWVTMSVVDNGPGIADTVAERLFTPFFTTRAEGMGLGLSLCRTVIEQHGGVLEFGPASTDPEAAADGDGPPRRGTVFRFTLPAARQAESRAATALDA